MGLQVSIRESDDVTILDLTGRVMSALTLICWVPTCKRSLPRVCASCCWTWQQ